jgi:hypothetical protein
LVYLVGVVIRETGIMTFEYSFGRTTVSQSWFSSEYNSEPSDELRKIVTGDVPCEVSCDPSGAVCEGFSQEMNCQGSEDPNALIAKVDLLHGGDSFCYTPLSKSGSVRADVEVTFSAKAPTEIEEPLQFVSEIKASETGITSCRALRKSIGRSAAKYFKQRLSKAFIEK